MAYFPVTDIVLWKQTTANADTTGYITAVCEPGGVAIAEHGFTAEQDARGRPIADRFLADRLK